MNIAITLTYDWNFSVVAYLSYLKRDMALLMESGALHYKDSNEKIGDQKGEG